MENSLGPTLSTSRSLLVIVKRNHDDSSSTPVPNAFAPVRHTRARRLPGHATLPRRRASDRSDRSRDRTELAASPRGPRSPSFAELASDARRSS